MVKMCTSKETKEMQVHESTNDAISFEEALDATGMGKYNYGVMFLCGCMLVSMTFESVSVSVIVPASACELNTTPAQQGIMAATPLAGIIVFSHIWGYLADTRGRRIILIISLAIGSVAGCLSAFSPNWMVYVFFKFISCSAVAGTNALTFTLLCEFMPSSYRNATTLVCMSMFMMGQGLQVVVSMPILPLSFSYYVSFLDIYFNSWRLLTVVYSMPCILCALVMFRTAESPKFLYSRGRTEEAMDVLRNMYAINKGCSPDDFPVKSVAPSCELDGKLDESMWSSIVRQTVPLVRAPYLKNTLILGGLYVVVFICAMPYLSWLPTMADGYTKALARGEEGLTICQMLRSTANFTQHQESSGCVLNQDALLTVFVVGLIFTSLNLAMGGLVERVGRRNLLLVIPVVSSAAGLTLNFITNIALSVTLLITYLCSVISMGLLTAFTVHVYPTHLRAMAVCLTLMVGRGSAVIGVNILKKLLDEDCETSFYLFGSITLMGAVIAWFLPKDSDTGAGDDSGGGGGAPQQRPHRTTLDEDAAKHEIKTIS